MNQKLSPTLTVITRCYQRPDALYRCKTSLQAQTDLDFEQVMVVDETGQGIHWSNRQISELAGKLHGQYVYILDDDDFIICESFIHELKLGIKDSSNPEVIIVRGWIHEKEYPLRWREAPARQKIAAPNFIVRRDIFDKYAHYWDVERRGDFNFINAVWINGHKFKWWDRYIFFADPSSGKTQDEKNVIRERVYY